MVPDDSSGVCCRRIRDPKPRMLRQLFAIICFPLMMPSGSTLSNDLWASQVESIKQTASLADNIPVAHASCGYQATEVLLLRAPGVSSPIGTVKCDEAVTIIYDEVGYYKVQVANGTQGYISRPFVTSPDPNASIHDGSQNQIARFDAKGIAPPKCSHCPDPKFTPEARAAKYQGKIVLEAIITADGKVTFVRAAQVMTIDKHVIGSLALDRAWVSLEEAAIDSVKRWRFEAARDADGKPIAVSVPIEIMFRLLN